MSDLQQMRDRNKAFAASYENKLHIMPRFQTIVLTCADGRIDPAHFLGLDLGDAVVFRNAGARITDEIELELGVLWGMAKKMAGDQFPGFGLAVVKHTDCGFERLANPDLAAMLSQSLNVAKAVIDDLAIRDHMTEIQADMLRLQQSAVVPKELVVSGHIYDVHTGLLQEVVAPSALREVDVVHG